MGVPTAIKVLVLFLCVVPLLGQEVMRLPDQVHVQDEESKEVLVDVEDYGPSYITGDTNEDGSVDFALRLDDRSEKLFEALDFNHDGRMDDFYYYARGVLHRQELDTNYDGEIDLWIYMHNGVYVRGYERDTDYDGVIDVIKEFGDR